MEMLEVGLAFTVAMILFSSVVSALVETILRSLALRRRYVANSVRSMLQDLIARHAGETFLAAAPAKANPEEQAQATDAWIEDLTDDLTCNRSKWDPKVNNQIKGKDYKRVENLSLTGLATRLVENPLGEAIKAGAPGDIARQRDQWNIVLRCYARHKALTSERHRIVANRTAVLVAIVFAFVFNVHAGRLVAHFSTSVDVREKLIANPEQIIEDANDAVEALNALGAEASPEEKEVVEAFQVAAGSLEPLTADGTLPIGVKYYPYCDVFAKEGEPRICPPDNNGLVLWIVNVLLAGILIGLGGPFWYRVFDGLSNLTKILSSWKGTSKNRETLQPPTQAESNRAGNEVSAVVEEILQVTNGEAYTLPPDWRAAPSSKPASDRATT
ncbi:MULTISPECIES: hypothetical protein [unclassified Meridianimarinicoccus]|uniref:hypothetical protein n=1 Tax=unclassified Meridianimarinicoccus TaxID=2923344 RepID=UPI0018671484|nr:hypothetical protein [Fluviibacterium sp. MJW13]